MSSLNLIDWVTSSGKYPERVQSSELTEEVKANAVILIDKVNKYLNKIHYNKEIKVSSGFRPSNINTAVGGAKRSAHMSGLAIDLEDVNEELAELNKKNSSILRELGLFVENPNVTKLWEHYDMVIRSDRPNRLFNP